MKVFFWPLPLIESLISKLAKAVVFTAIDLSRAYHSIGVDEPTKALLAIVTPFGIYEPQRMTLGTATAALLIFKNGSIDEHKEHLKLIIQKLEDLNVTLSVHKCKFFCTSLRLLGYIVSVGKVEIDKEKFASIDNLPYPIDVSQVRHILGVAGFFRKFIAKFADLTAPLTNLLRKGVPFYMGTEEKKAFDQVKHLLKTAPALRLPDFDKPFFLHCDASDVGISGVLREDKQYYYAVRYAVSRKLQKGELSYGITMRELLAVVYSVLTLRHYLHGATFTIFTDHQALQYFERLKDPSGKLARWWLTLQSYSYRIVYIAGKKNILPDAFSRFLGGKPKVSIDDIKQEIRNIKDDNINLMDAHIIKGVAPYNGIKHTQCVEIDHIRSHKSKEIHEDNIRCL
eukprot:Nk52_evm1s1895 gene=Nk52_evmTU1s1895